MTNELGGNGLLPCVLLIDPKHFAPDRRSEPRATRCWTFHDQIFLALILDGIQTLDIYSETYINLGDISSIPQVYSCLNICVFTLTCLAFISASGWAAEFSSTLQWDEPPGGADQGTTYLFSLSTFVFKILTWGRVQMFVLILSKMADRTSEQGGGANECDLVNFISLLTQMLKVDPSERITPRGILEHPFITMSHFQGEFNNSP